jgi:hypothetical protein
MMFNSTAQAKIDSLQRQATEAIQQYNKDVAAGGEPAFPDWAIDLLALLDSNERMVIALNEWKRFAANNNWTAEDCTFLHLTTEALARAGAV